MALPVSYESRVAIDTWGGCEISSPNWFPTTTVQIVLQKQYITWLWHLFYIAQRGREEKIVKLEVCHPQTILAEFPIVALIDHKLFRHHFQKEFLH